MEIQAAIVLIIVFFLLLAFSVPVSFSIISASLVTLIMFLTPHFGVFISAQKMVTGIDSFTLLAVPFFVLAGLLMSNGGIAKRLINLAMLVLGKVPGSLAMTNIAGNAMFGSGIIQYYISITCYINYVSYTTFWCVYISSENGYRY